MKSSSTSISQELYELELSELELIELDEELIEELELDDELDELELIELVEELEEFSRISKFCKYPDVTSLLPVSYLDRTGWKYLLSSVLHVMDRFCTRVVLSESEYISKVSVVPFLSKVQ